MTKHTKTTAPPSAEDFTLALFCRIDDQLQDVPKHTRSHLHPSEIVTLGALQVLRGQGWRPFYRWVQAELASLFPRLPEQSRLFRLWVRYHHLAKRFLAAPTALGVCDTFGIELLHPKREGRCPWHFARKGKSNHRWIVGAKWFVLLNQQGQIVRIGCCSAYCMEDIVYDAKVCSHCHTLLVARSRWRTGANYNSLFDSDAPYLCALIEAYLVRHQPV